MKEKIICLMICMLFFITFLPSTSSINIIQINQKDNDFNCSEESNDYFEQNYVVMQNPPDLSYLDNTSFKPVAQNTPDEFSWADYNGKDWTTPAKHQGSCGSCWAFGAMSVLESIIKIREDCADFNPDLSEQYILSCLPGAGSCRGGNSYRALDLIKKTTSEGNNCNGVIFESCMQYQADDDIPCSDKCTDWEEKLVPLFDFSSWTSDGSAEDRQAIKTQVMETGPVITHIRATDFLKIWGALNKNPDAYYKDFRKVLAYNHVVMIVGWKDDPSINNGGYWIIKNSWGENWGYNGFFNIEYNSLNIDICSIISPDYDADSFNWAPVVKTGGSYGTILGEETRFDASNSIGVEADISDFQWDFGDGHAGNGITTSHTYLQEGKYTVTLTLTDSENNMATKTTSVWVQETNNPPNKPTVTGQTPGTIGIPYEYSFSTTDSNDNDIWYMVDWDDGSDLEWLGPFDSGEELSLKYRWTMFGNYELKVKTKDSFGDESPWSDPLPVKMSRERPKNITPFQSFLQNHPLLMLLFRLLYF